MGTLAQGATTHPSPFGRSPSRRRAATGAALLAILAGLLHLLLAPQHMDHLGHGLFLTLAGVAQVAWGVAFWRKPSTALYNLGIVLAGTLIALWAITRVLPAPFGHGGPGEVEAYGILSKAAEGLGLAVLLAMVFGGERSLKTQGLIRRTLLALLMVAGISAFILYGAGLAAEQAFPWLGDDDEDNLAQQLGLSDAAPALPSASSASSASVVAPSTPLAPEAGSTAAPAIGALPSLTELLRVLVRDGVGPVGTHLQMVYAPPLLFQVSGQGPPASSLRTPAVIFMMLEDGHQSCEAIPDQPAEVSLRLDQGEFIRASDVTVLHTDEDFMERTTRLLFPLPPGLNPGTLADGTHTLTIVVPLESTRETVFTWQLPLPLATQP